MLTHCSGQRRQHLQAQDALCMQAAVPGAAEHEHCTPPHPAKLQRLTWQTWPGEKSPPTATGYVGRHMCGFTIRSWMYAVALLCTRWHIKWTANKSTQPAPAHQATRGVLHESRGVSQAPEQHRVRLDSPPELRVQQRLALLRQTMVRQAPHKCLDCHSGPVRSRRRVRPTHPPSPLYPADAPATWVRQPRPLPTNSSHQQIPAEERTKHETYDRGQSVRV